ncbi:hypothetical protein [Streptomyces sp. NPDC088789]|uniref:hypothetical protein n=1 Tax=Streptomyces sp. NPDC088789 TaxID=3365899 RepID=UPI00380E3357
MRRDLYAHLAPVTTLAPAARTASATGTGVDLANYDGAVAIVHAGAWTDGTHTFDVQDSDDNTTFTSVAGDFLSGTEPVVSNSGTAGTVYRIGYHGIRRYVRVAVTVAGATTGAVYGAHIVRGYARTKR